MTKTRIEKLVEKRNLLDQEIQIELGNLNGCGDVCKCEREKGSVSFIHEGNMFNEIHTY